MPQDFAADPPNLQLAALHVCEHCDEVYRRHALARGQHLVCARCGSVVEHHPAFDIGTWLALTITAACLFVFANVFPVAEISFGGLANRATVMQAIFALADGPGAPVAVAAGVVTLIIPAAQIAALLWLLAYAASGRRSPFFVACMALLHAMRPWGMTEVFLLGVIVAIVKLSSYLHVVVGVGVASIALLAPLMVVITTRGSEDLWQLACAA